MVSTKWYMVQCVENSKFSWPCKKVKKRSRSKQQVFIIPTNCWNNDWRSKSNGSRSYGVHKSVLDAQRRSVLPGPYRRTTGGQQRKEKIKYLYHHYVYMQFALKVILGRDGASMGWFEAVLLIKCQSKCTHNRQISLQDYNSGKIQGIWFLKYCGYPDLVR